MIFFLEKWGGGKEEGIGVFVVRAKLKRVRGIVVVMVGR